jgi:hypothetical protein
VIRRVTAAGVSSVLAGTAGTFGSDDGTGSAARFRNPSGIVLGADGNLYVSDFLNHTIRRVTPEGEVTTLAGLAGTSGTDDGTGSAARFFRPTALARDAAGDLYVTDSFNHTVRRITTAGVVTTLAGSPGNFGSTDGTGSAALFFNPRGLAVDSSGNLFVSDAANHTIRRVTPAGVVTTFAGTAGESGVIDATGTAARFNNPLGLAFEPDGNLIVSDYLNSTLRRITPDGVVTTIGGAAGLSGSTDGIGTAARFSGPSGITFDSAGNLYLTDFLSHTVRKGSSGGALSSAPVITGATTASGTYASVFGGYTITATNTPTAFAATGLPSGLSLDTTTGAITGTPTQTGVFEVSISATNSAGTGTATLTLTINKAPATVTLSGLSKTYSGSAQGATVTTAPAGLTLVVTYNGSSTVPTNAGSYTVVATVNDTNYQGSATGTLVIAKANASITLGGLSRTYTGSPQGATAATSPAGLTVSFSYNGSGTTPTNAGSYAVVATINDINYQGTATGTLVIAKATATVTLGGLSKTFNGGPQGATATTTPTGLTVNLTYNGSATMPTAAGSYTVVGTINDANYQGSATGTLVIAKASSVVVLSNLTQTYTGTALSPTATTTPAGMTVLLTYNGSPTAPTNAGSYAVVATVDDANFFGTASGTFTINKAPATVTLGSLSTVYSGAPQAATATTVPAGLNVIFTYDGSATAPTNAGSYAVGGTINDTNYEGSASGTLVIAKAPATVTLGDLGKTYNGSPQGATATTNPAGLNVEFTYNGSSTVPTNAGSYAVVATINETNFQGSTNGTLVIGKAPATVTLGGLSKTYNGSAQGATATTNPAGLAVTFTYNGSTTAPTVAGSYTVVGAINDANYQGSAIGTLVIAKASTVVTLADLTKTYTGGPLSPTATTTPAGMTVVLTYGGSFNIPVNAGTYAVLATVDDPNFFGTASGTFTILKAPATVTLGSLSKTYNGSAQGASATTNPAGLAVTFTYDGSATAPTNAGSYTVVGTINDPNYAGSAIDTLVIAKAPATVTLGGLSKTYNGSAQGASATTNPAGLAVTFTYDGSTTAPTPAGSYSVVGTINDTNYQGSTTGTLVIAKASSVVVLSNLTQTYTGSALTPTAITTPAGMTVLLTYNGFATAPTNAGSYAVVATVDDANFFGTASGTFTINKAPATVTLGSLSTVYSGSPQAATATTVPAGLNVTFTYDGSATAPTDAGSYAVVGSVVDANYIGSASGTLVIAKAPATVTLGGLAKTYNGSAQGATATTNPAGLTVTFTYNGSATAPTNAGSYAVVATINERNYAGSANGTLVIAKAPATVTLRDLAQTYTGSARPVAATTSPAGLAVNFTYDGSATPPINAGSYAVVGTINEANYVGSATGTLVVAKALAGVAFESLTARYTGSPLAPTVVTTPAGLVTTLTFNGGATAPTGLGTYAVVATVQDANYTGSASGSFVIEKGLAVVTLSRLNTTYDGEFKNIGFRTTPAGLPIAFTYNGDAEPPSAAGTYEVVAKVYSPLYEGEANATLTIAKAPLTLRANDQRRFVGEANPSLTYTVEGLVGSDTAGTAFTGQPALSTTATDASPDGVYPITIAAGTVSSDNYAPSFAPGELELALWTFADWQARHFAPGAPAAVATADPDGDGLANLVEYALDRDPLAPDAADALVHGTADGRLTLGHLARRDTADLGYSVEWSEDLVTWRGDASARGEFARLPVDAWSDFVTTRAQAPRSTGREFLRLQVNLND